MESNDLIKSNNGLIYKAETILKHQNKLNETRERKARQKLQSIIYQKQKKNVLKTDFKRPEDFVHNYKNKQRNYANYLQRKRKNIEDFPFKEQELIFVVRIVGNKDLSDNQKNLFKGLKLQKIHEGTFFRVNDNLKKAIQSLENKIIFGKLPRETLKNLITKRGYLRNNKEIKQISSNKIVEDILGQFGLICIEDIVSDIYSSNENYKDIKKYLCTFKLNKPTEGYGEKNMPLTKGGSWGNWNDKLDNLIKNMI